MAENRTQGAKSKSSGSGKPIHISSGAIEPRTDTNQAVDQLVNLANVLGVNVAQGASINTVQQALENSYTQAVMAQAEATEASGFASLSDEALLMADEMMKKEYPLPEFISERTIRLQHLGLKALLNAQYDQASGTAEEQKQGYLQMEVFAPGAAPNQHTVEPLDAQNISWDNPLLPRLYIGPMAADDVQANAFIFTMGLAICFVVLYMMNKMRMLEQTFSGNKKTIGSVAQVFSNGSQSPQHPQIPSDENERKDWRDNIIGMLKVLGQLKRKGKFDLNSEFMKPKRSQGNPISNPAASLPQAKTSLLGNPNSRNILDDINSGVMGTNDVGGYTPTEMVFPLEAKLVEPKYALEPASPSSDIEQYMQQTPASGNAKKEFEFDNPSNL